MIDLLVDALATYRLTRFVTRDSLLDRPRHAFFVWALGSKPRVAHPMLLELSECHWCVGMWAAFLVPFLPRRVRRGLAIACAAGLIGGAVPKD